ncbi:MAG: hypothetical protein JW768_09585 [Chitinispirillaceae bacterium]|nr:hypothetical protein [Chitinispirillaceae bacterium]
MSFHRAYGAALLRRICFFPVLLILCGVTVVRADDSLAIRYATEMTRLPAGSDIVALGETGVVLPRHGVASLWNPAAPAFLDSYEFSAEFADLYGGMSHHGCVAMTVPFSDNLGSSVMYLPFLSGPIERYDTLLGSYTQRQDDRQEWRANGKPLSTFSNNQHLIVVSIAKMFPLSMPRSSEASFPLPFEIGAGFSFKSFWQTMKPDTLLYMGMNVNLDAGMLMVIGVDYSIEKKKVSRQILLGASARDIVPSPVVWINSRDEYNPNREYREMVTRSYYAGMAYVDKSGNLGGNWTLSAGAQRQYRTTYHFGIEAEFWDMVAFRTGLSDKVPSVGAGVRYKKYFLDYTFRFDELAYSYVRLALGVHY